MIDLKEIQERAEKATAGPWKWKKAHSEYGIGISTPIWGFVTEFIEPDDADFIAHSRTDIPALLALVDQQQKEIERLRRERAAAVEDMKIMALAMRESEELSEGCCFACICEAGNLPDNCILPYGECPGYERDDCFEWRGLKEAEKAIGERGEKDG